jgi:hypothetical protein
MIATVSKPEGTSVSSIEITAIVALGTLALGYTIARGPRPDPKLAAEPLWKVVGEVVALMAGATLWSFVLVSVPRDAAIILAVGSTVLAVAAGTWWHRRRA